MTMVKMMMMFMFVSRGAEIPPQLCQSVPSSTNSKHGALYLAPPPASPRHTYLVW